MNDPTMGDRPLTLADIFESTSRIVEHVEARRKKTRWWLRFLWLLVRPRVKKELDWVLGGSIDEMLEDVFRSDAEEESQATFGEITKLLKKAKKARKELERYQRATPQEPADFKLGIKQTITWKMLHTIRLNAVWLNIAEIELDIRIVLAFKGASVGVSQRDLHYLSLGSCHIGRSTLKVTVRPGTDPAGGTPLPTIRPPKSTKKLRRIPFVPAITIPFMDRRTGPRRTEGERRVDVVEAEIERRAAFRRVADRRGGPDRRQLDRRGSDRREGVDQRVTEDRRNTKA